MTVLEKKQILIKKIQEIPDNLVTDTVFADIQISINQISEKIQENNRVFGRFKGKYKLAADFDEPLEDFKFIDKPRQNWEKAFTEMQKNGEDKLLIESVFSDEKN